MFPIIVLALPFDWLGGTSGMAVEPIEIGGRMLSTRSTCITMRSPEH